MSDPTQPRVTRAIRRLRDATKRRPPQRSPGELIEPYLDRLQRDDQPRVTTSGRILCYGILNEKTDILERRLLAFIDAIACQLDHDDYGGVFGARLALLAIVDPATTEAALAALTGEET